jgi:hypothetical protein
MSSVKGKGAASAAPTLGELATEIRAMMEKGDRTALDHALEVGALLIQAKPQVAKGRWEIWVRETLGMPRNQSARCIRFASNVSRVIHCKTVREADELLRKPSGKPKQPSAPKQKPRESGKRLRSLHAKRRAGDTSNLMNMRLRVQQVVSTLEAVDLPTYGVEDADRETITEIHDELALLATWLDQSLGVLADCMDDLQKMELIRKLREDTNGRTDAEVATALRLAEKLQRKLGSKITA